MAGQTIDGAVENSVPFMDTLWGERALGDNSISDTLHPTRAFELVKDHLAVLRQHLGPIMIGAKVGSMNQDIESFTPLWSDTRFGRSRCARLRCRIRRRFALSVDVVKLFVWVFGEYEIMVQDVFVAFLQA
jgi:hypothetical protein